jgi:hypothetical protein
MNAAIGAATSHLPCYAPKNQGLHRFAGLCYIFTLSLSPKEGLVVYRYLFAVLLTLTVALPSFAQASWQFRWTKGLALNYKIKHVTSVVEVVENAKNTSDSQLDLVNRWQVLDVDAKGIATMQLTLTAMRNEQKRGNGDMLLFDSQNLEKSTPELREQMKKYIGTTLAIVRVDAYGRVHEVKQGSAASYDAEPPFLIVFPEAKPAAGQAWRRPFTLVLEPPFGAGEKFEVEQRYECKKIVGAKAALSVSTHFKVMPDNMRERIPLIQKDVEGEISFDVLAGRLLSAQLVTDKMVENHQGKGSSYHYKSQYSRMLVE